MIDHNAQHHISTNQAPAIVVWLIRASFAATGPEHFTVIELMMNSSVDKKYCGLKCGDICPAAKGCWNWVMQEDGDPQEQQQIYKTWLNPDISLTEVMWWYFRELCMNENITQLTQPILKRMM